MPQGLAGPLVHRHEISGRVAVEEQTPRRRQNARLPLALNWPLLKPFPNDASGINVESPKVLLGRISLWRRGFPILTIGIDCALLRRHDIVEPRQGAEGGGIPVGRRVRTSECALFYEPGTPVRANTACPSQFFHEGLSQQDPAIGPVEHVKEAVAI